MYNLKESDSGYYICNAENSVGRNRDYVYLTVEREDGGEARPDDDRRQDDQQQQRTTEPPAPVNKPFVYIKTQSNGKLIKVGEEFQLVCIANGKSGMFRLRGEQLVN